MHLQHIRKRSEWDDAITLGGSPTTIIETDGLAFWDGGLDLHPCVTSWPL